MPIARPVLHFAGHEHLAVADLLRRLLPGNAAIHHQYRHPPQPGKFGPSALLFDAANGADCAI